MYFLCLIGLDMSVSHLITNESTPSLSLSYLSLIITNVQKIFIILQDLNLTSLPTFWVIHFRWLNIWYFHLKYCNYRVVSIKIHLLYFMFVCVIFIKSFGINNKLLCFTILRLFWETIISSLLRIRQESILSSLNRRLVNIISLFWYEYYNKIWKYPYFKYIVLWLGG